MLTPEQIADGWKPHDGSRPGECPLQFHEKAQVMTRDGRIHQEAKAPDAYWWRIASPMPCDIIAYREEPSDAA